MINNVYYDKNGLVLVNDDCIKFMDNLIDNNIKVDKVITSPPYNIVRPNAVDRGYDEFKDRLKTNDEYSDWCVDIFNHYDKLLNKNGVIMWNMNYGTENTECMSLCIADIIRKTNFTLADILVWKKTMATPNNVSRNKMTRICEFIYVFCRRDEFDTFTCNKRVISVSGKGQNIYENVHNFFSAPNNDSSQELNKATFSTDFVKELMNRYVLKTDVILDNFSGTGTTMKSCFARGLKGYFCELSKAQCEYTVKRIDTGAQMNIFDV